MHIFQNAKGKWENIFFFKICIPNTETHLEVNLLSTLHTAALM